MLLNCTDFSIPLVQMYFLFYVTIKPGSQLEENGGWKEPFLLVAKKGIFVHFKYVLSLPKKNIWADVFGLELQCFHVSKFLSLPKKNIWADVFGLELQFFHMSVNL